MVWSSFIIIMMIIIIIIIIIPKTRNTTSLYNWNYKGKALKEYKKPHQKVKINDKL